ncbi:putative DNA-binding transcriptional regulator AlpA [Kitasatospora gansuensis]|uniref:Putative DNA-binding transcriptional regulator AlpA n=1 Tax=Kitasatospora gansuensis TaxID=258050 RepID=A0A7W7SDW9_9ACTN|nr:AlpA family phage regulatory protein [Kitasatospora gansuensis]MBB4948648.1 putative DNA-binding transcriptional regulator AlpA [Kitasatospora gansuensis]
MPKRELLKLPAVLDEIDMSRAAFYRMQARGKGPRVMKLPNGQIRVDRVELDAWLSSCEVAA